MNPNQQKGNTTDESASIYQRRDEKTERQKLKDMTFKQKVNYFNNYYRLKVIIFVAIAAMLISTIYTMVTPDAETVFYAAVVNNAIDDETAATLQAGFGKHLGIDEENQNVVIDTSFVIGTEDNVTEYSLATQQKLTAFMVASQIDVIIASESDFASYAYYETLSKLTDQLPTDLCSTLADSFFYSDSENDSTVSAYGIYLDGAKIYDDNGELIDKPVLGITVNTKYSENAIEFIRYLFQLTE